jgi:hypothetical protein
MFFPSAATGQPESSPDSRTVFVSNVSIYIFLLFTLLVMQQKSSSVTSDFFVGL